MSPRSLTFDAFLDSTQPQRFTILSAKARRLSKPAKKKERTSSVSVSLSQSDSAASSPNPNQSDFSSLTSSLILTSPKAEPQDSEEKDSETLSQSQVANAPTSSEVTSSSFPLLQSDSPSLSTTSIPSLPQEIASTSNFNSNSDLDLITASNVSLPASSSHSRSHSHLSKTPTSSPPPTTTQLPVTRMASPLPSRASVSPAPSHSTSATFGPGSKSTSNLTNSQPQRNNSIPPSNSGNQFNVANFAVGNAAPPTQIINGPSGRILCVADVRGESLVVLLKDLLRGTCLHRKKTRNRSYESIVLASKL